MLKVSTGQLTITNNQNLASLTEIPSNNTIAYTVAGFERSQGQYLFTVQSYGNGSLNLVFRGIQPVVVRGANIASQSYSSISSLQSITYTASQTTGLAVIYAGVAPNIGNAVAGGSGLLVALILLITVGFIIILIFAVKAASEKESERIGIFLSPMIAFLFIVIIFLVILAFIAAFTPYFNGLGI